MSSRPLTGRRRTAGPVTAILVATLVAAGAQAGEQPMEPDPVVGRVAGQAIRASHADELRALLSPPPSRAAAFLLVKPRSGLLPSSFLSNSRRKWMRRLPRWQPTR